MKAIFKYPLKFQKSILAIIAVTIILQMLGWVVFAIQYSVTMDMQVFLQSILGNITTYFPIIVFFIIFLIIKNKKTPLLTSLFDTSVWTLFWLLIMASFDLIINTFFSSLFYSNDTFLGAPLIIIEMYVASLVITGIVLGKYLTLKSENQVKKFSQVFKIAFTVIVLVPIISSLPYQVISGNSGFITIASYLIAIFALLIPGYFLLGKMDMLSKIFTISIGAFYAMMLFGFVQIPLSVSSDEVLKNVILILSLIVAVGWFNLTMFFAKKTAR